MSRRLNKYGTQAGYSVAELISVVFVMGLALTTVALIVGPLFRSPTEAQAKLDTVQSAAQGLYLLQRDLRETDSSSVWACTNSGVVSCNRPSTSQSPPIIAIATARDANGQLQWDTSDPTLSPYLGGRVVWQGVWVYWLVADPTDAGAFDVERAYQAIPGPHQAGPAGLPSATQVQIAVSAALVSGGANTVQHSVSGFTVLSPGTNLTAAIQVNSISTVDNHVNTTTYRSDTLVRNVAGGCCP